MSSEQEENSCEAGAISETTENAEQQPEVIENETQKRKGIATDEDSIHYTPAEKIIQIILSLMLVVTGSVNTLAAKYVCYNKISLLINIIHKLNDLISIYLLNFSDGPTR